MLGGCPGSLAVRQPLGVGPRLACCTYPTPRGGEGTTAGRPARRDQRPCPDKGVVTAANLAQPGQKEVRAQLEKVADMLSEQFPTVAELLPDAKADRTAFSDFPRPHWQKIWSTNPLERLNREVKRRTDVVGIFPTPAALLRLSSCVLIEAHDEWQDSDRRYLSQESMALLNPPSPTVLETKTNPATKTTRRQIAATA